MSRDAKDKVLSNHERFGIDSLTCSDDDRDELLSLPISELGASENNVEAARYFNRIVPLERALMADKQERKEEASVRFAEVSTPGSALNKGRHFSFIRDNTDHKDTTFTLEQKSRELEQFLYSISHDLKSPLLTVRTYTDMLRRDLLNADQSQISEGLHYIDKATDKMQQLLDALLQYSLIGNDRTHDQTLSAGQLLDDCLTALAGIIQQQQVTITINQLPRQLRGDPLHFERIWQNLIENAIKYNGDQTQPDIQIGATQQGQEVVFYVRDNGIGIAPEQSERIFNLFSQLNTGSDGNGLGLALVKKIVSIYQGRIWLESAGDGQGSCFMFTLPEALVKQDKAT